MPRLTATPFRRGFTLVELIVSLAILAIVGTLVVRVAMGQQQFHHLASEQMRMRRELRSTMQLVPADLRSISSSGGDIETIAEEALTFRAVIGSSVVCALPSSATIDLPPGTLARTTLTHFSSPPVPGDTVWVFDDSTAIGAEDDRWLPREIVAVTPRTNACLGSPLLDAALDEGKVGTRLTVDASLPASVTEGSGLRITRRTRYQLDAQASGRWYLTRSEFIDGAWTSAAPISGPFEAPTSASGTAGVRFAYFDSLGAAVTSPVDARRIARIDLRLTATGAVSSNLAARGMTATRDSLAFRIALRNRQ